MRQKIRLIRDFEEGVEGKLPIPVTRIGDEYHELSGRAKDMGSAAVFIMLVYTVVVWAVILLHNYAGLF